MRGRKRLTIGKLELSKTRKLEEGREVIRKKKKEQRGNPLQPSLANEETEKEVSCEDET